MNVYKMMYQKYYLKHDKYLRTMYSIIIFYSFIRYKHFQSFGARVQSK